MVHFQQFADPRVDLWNLKIGEKISGKIFGFFFFKRQFEKKINLNLKRILNGRLLEQQLKVKIIYRNGDGKRKISIKCF